MSTRLPPIDPAERKVLRFEFATELGSASISSAAMQAAVVAGADAAPSAILDGAHQVSGTDVLQIVTGGVTGCDYRLRCLVTDSAGLKHLIVGTLPVRTGD